jgi:hypothetical protein
MKDSPHHRNHLKSKAIKEANTLQDSGPLPEEMIQNPNFKKQFNAKSEESAQKIKKPHKQTSKKVVEHAIEPDYMHKEQAHWTQVSQAQTKEKNLLLNKRLSKQVKK